MEPCDSCRSTPPPRSAAACSLSICSRIAIDSSSARSTRPWSSRTPSMSPEWTSPGAWPTTFARWRAGRLSRSEADAAMGTDVATTRRVDVAELLTAMLSVPSPSGEEDAVASLLVSRLLHAGFDVDVDAAGNVVAAWGDGPETIALVGHVGRVPGRIGGRRDGDLTHGAGAVDAKGPLATAIAAVRRQPRHGARRFVIVGAVEEETSSRGARHLAESMAPPASLVILEPSGWDAVTIGYKGSLRLRASVEQPHAHGAGREPRAPARCVDGVRALQDRAADENGDAAVFDRVDVRVLRFVSAGDGLRDSACVDLGVRTPPGCGVGALIEVARAAAPTADLTVL